MKYALGLAALLLASTPVMAQSISAQTSAPGPSVLVTGTHTFNGYTVIAPVAGRLMVFDSASIPADGAVTPAGCWKVGPVASGDTSTMTSMGNVPNPAVVYNGAALVFSDSLSCYTLHKANAEFILAIYQ